METAVDGQDCSGEGVRDRSGRHHAGRDDAAARRLGDSGSAAQVPGDRAHQGGADHRPRPGGRQEPRQPGGCRRLPDQAVRPERDDPRGPRAGQRHSAEPASPCSPQAHPSDHRRAAGRAIGVDDRSSGRARSPGSYTTSLPFRLGPDPRTAADALAARLREQLWIATAEVTGPGFVTVTVTHATLARLAIRIAHAGPACAESDALAGRTITPRPFGRRSGLAAGAGGPRRRTDRPPRRRRGCHH